MTSGSKVVMNLVKSGQLFFTRRRKLLAFQVKNFVGSFLGVSSSDISPFLGDGRLGFLADPSFSTGWKKRFIVPRALSSNSVCFPLEQNQVPVYTSTQRFAEISLQSLVVVVHVCSLLQLGLELDRPEPELKLFILGVIILSSNLWK